MNILAADDDKISRMLLRSILEQGGRHKVTLATDGEEAWWLLKDQQNRYDAAVLDVVMPRIDGIDLLHRIRQTAGLETLPVVLCTGAADRTTVERAAQLSANHYIVKPFTASVVLSKLDAIETDLMAHQDIEDLATVCARLGIDTGTHASLVDALLTELHDWTTATRAVSVSGRFDRMALRANSLKGASANLGLRNLALVLGQAELRLEAAAANELPLGFLVPEADMLPLLDQVTHSAAKVRLSLKAAA